jgi:long-subunit fatty acid transport protein
LSTVKVVDPVVYFGGLNYTKNYGTREEFGYFEAGDSWGFNIGMAIALNLNNSLSLAYDQQFSSRSELDDTGIPDSYFTTGVFSVGSSYTFGSGTTLDLKLGIGLTKDSPDVILSTALPFRGDFGWGR